MVEDLLWNALENINLHLEVEKRQFQEDIVSLLSSGLSNVTDKLPQYQELSRAVAQMTKAARDRVTDGLNDAEKELYRHPDKAGKKLLEEYHRSALETVINIAWHRNLVDNSVAEKVFAPRIVEQEDL